VMSPLDPLLVVVISSETTGIGGARVGRYSAVHGEIVRVTIR
jgi:hypothetical protein